MTTISNLVLTRLLCAQKRERRSSLQQTVATFQSSPPTLTVSRQSLDQACECPSCKTTQPRQGWADLEILGLRQLLLGSRKGESDDPV